MHEAEDKGEHKERLRPLSSRKNEIRLLTDEGIKDLQLVTTHMATQDSTPLSDTSLKNVENESGKEIVCWHNIYIHHEGRQER